MSHDNHDLLGAPANRPAWTAEGYTAMLENLRGIQEDHSLQLELRDIKNRALNVLSPNDQEKVMRAGPTAQAVVYARHLPADPDANGPRSAEFGVAFKFPDPDATANERIQTQVMYAPIGTVAGGVILPVQSPLVHFDTQEVQAVHDMAHELNDKRQSGEIPYLSADLTTVPDMGQPMAWPPRS